MIHYTEFKLAIVFSDKCQYENDLEINQYCSSRCSGKLGRKSYIQV